jgi:hypothetical protein
MGQKKLNWEVKVPEKLLSCRDNGRGKTQHNNKIKYSNFLKLMMKSRLGVDHQPVSTLSLVNSGMTANQF